MVGRDQVIEEMSEGVVLVGVDGRVRDLNSEAESLFDVDRSAVVGEPLHAVAASLPDPGSVIESEPTDVRTQSGSAVSVTTDTVTDDHRRTLGYLLICRDITQRRRREHRLGILTQLLAGATQQELTDIEGVATGIVNGDRQPAAGGDRIHDTATDVATLVARVRDVERALAEQPDDDSTTVDLTAVLSEFKASIAVEIEGKQPDRPLYVTGDPALLIATLDALATGAVASDASLTIRVDETSNRIEVTISPFDPSDDGSVTAHSFRIARLATEHTDWRIQTVDDSAGPRVTLQLPMAHEDARTPSPGGDAA